MSPLRRFLHELHTRSVWQVMASYVGVSWLVLEITQHMQDRWGLPAGAYPIAFVVLLLGLPFIVATAWLQDEPWQRSGTKEVAGSAEMGSRSSPDAEGTGDTRAAPGPSPDSVADRVFTWRNTLLGGLGVVALCALLWVGWSARVRGQEGGATVTFASAWPSIERDYEAGLFVSMLRDISPEQSYGHLAEGITEELIHSLAHLERLRVPSFTSSAALEGANLRPPEIAEVMDVDHLLEGTLATEGDHVRVIIQLVDAGADAHEWSLAFTGSLTDVFSLRQRIAAEVTDSVAAHLPVGGMRGEVERNAESPAHEAYLQGTQALARRTPAGIRDAMSAFDEAIALDPGYAPAYGGLSSAYALSITYRTALPLNAYSAAATSLSLATRSIEMAPDLAVGYAARGYVASVSFAPTSAVLEDFRRAMDLEPDAPEVPGWYSVLLRREGRIEEALASARRAVSLSPLAPGRRLGLAYQALHAREYELAVSEAREASKLEPGLKLAAAIEGRSLLLLDRAEECLELDLAPYVATRALCLLAVGRTEEGQQLVAALRSRLEAGTYSDPDYSELLPTEDLAVFYARTGQHALCLEWLERTFGLSPRGVDDSTVESGLFDLLLDQPGFRDELQRLREGAWVRVERLADHDEPTLITPLDP